MYFLKGQSKLILTSLYSADQHHCEQMIFSHVLNTLMALQEINFYSTIMKIDLAL